MNGQELKEAAQAYFEHQLEPQVTEAFEAHVAGCESCARFVQVAKERQKAGTLTDELMERVDRLRWRLGA